MDASSTPIAAGGPGADYRYWVFISYSHNTISASETLYGLTSIPPAGGNGRTDS
jgi:hypothetical protein